MTQSEFEALLATLLDGNILPSEFVDLENAIQSHPGYRGRFQGEFRLNSLLREIARGAGNITVNLTLERSQVL